MTDQPNALLEALRSIVPEIPRTGERADYPDDFVLSIQVTSGKLRAARKIVEEFSRPLSEESHRLDDLQGRLRDDAGLCKERSAACRKIGDTSGASLASQIADDCDEAAWTLSYLSALSRPTQPSGEANDALAKALRLLDTFGGEGLGHVYGNGQTIDADTCCAELAAAFGVELEAGWYRKVAALATRPAHGADEGEADRLAARIAETVQEDGGCWSACCGCQESVDGYVSSRDYPYSTIFKCQPGGGCRECGGLGVIWQDGEFLSSYGDALSVEPASGNGIKVSKIETVTGDFMQEPGEPYWRIEINGYCADFDTEQAASNFAAQINAPTTPARDAIEAAARVADEYAELRNEDGVLVHKSLCILAAEEIATAIRALALPSIEIAGGPCEHRWAAMTMTGHMSCTKCRQTRPMTATEVAQWTK